MIRKEKLNHALYALNLILTRVRFMAYSNEDYKDIANILDYAEALPRLIASDDDMTKDFRDYLISIVEQYPVCLYILEKFDEPSISSEW